MRPGGTLRAWRARVEEAAAGGATAWRLADAAVSWAEVLAEAERLEARWQSHVPLAQGPVRVALSLRDPRTFLTAWLAWMAVDAEVMPLHPRWTKAERALFLQRFPAHAVVSDEDGQVACVPADALPPPVPDPAALLLATSGSTGRPKAVLLDSAALEASTEASCAHLGLAGSDRWQTLLPLAHMGGIAPLLRMGWVGGGLVPTPSAAMSSGDATALHPDATAVSVVPLVLRRWLDAGLRPSASLRLVLCGGAATPEAWLQEALDAGWPVLTTWGMTETASQVASVRPGEETRSLTSAGALLPGVRVRFRGPNGARVGEGEIEVASPTLFRGYRDDPAATAACLRNGWLATGDVGRLEDGALQILGRRDALIIRGGENVYPAEVERALRYLPGVQDVCVVGVPSQRWGDEPVAVLLLASEAQMATGPALELRVLDASQARSFDTQARARLAAFRVPSAWYTVAAWPRTASGKLDHGALRAAILRLR